jgi:hypothetical protein
MSKYRDAIDRMHSRITAESGLGESDALDLVNLATVLLLREHQACSRLGEARSQIETLMVERDRNRGIVTEAQRIASSSSHTLTSILHRLVDAGQDVYVSALVSQGVEITYQPADAQHRTDECTFVGLTLDEVVASAHQHLTETT